MSTKSAEYEVCWKKKLLWFNLITQDGVYVHAELSVSCGGFTFLLLRGREAEGVTDGMLKSFENDGQALNEGVKQGLKTTLFGHQRSLMWRE